jgi:hypothetical protein
VYRQSKETDNRCDVAKEDRVVVFVCMLFTNELLSVLYVENVSNNLHFLSKYPNEIFLSELPLYNRDIPIFILALVARYSKGFCGFPQSFQANSEPVSFNRV